MMAVLKSLAAFVLVLGPLVFVHELGHFLVAKWLRIGVPVFSLGFGPRLFGLRRGGTDYRISAIPLGGYVRMAGDEADENRRGLPEEFLSRPKWQRFAVFVAGATFNVALAFGLSWSLFAIYGVDEVADPDSYPTVRAVVAASPAERAGMRAGDTIVEIGGKDVRGVDRYEEVYGLEIALAPKTTKTVVVERAGERVAFAVTIEPDPVYGHGADPGWARGLAWGGDGAPTLAAVSEGGPAAEAGLRDGDRVVAAGGREPITEAELRSLIEASANRDLALRVEREGRSFDVTVRPRDEAGVGRIGVHLGPLAVHRDLALGEAASHALRENLDNSLMLFNVLKRMVTREVPLRSVSGPIGIAQVARNALAESPRHFVWLLGFFSLQLGILNLLPIPVLDGGHILILAVEGAMRRDLSERLKERVMQVGFVFLLAFMSVVVYLDILKL
jgi:regulator of sigma E protease